jgi:hypothetical protein
VKKLLTLYLFIFHLSAGAQVFPVQVIPQIAPPYSPYLSDYTAPGSRNFMVQVRANDVALSDYKCKLRITIEGAGIVLRTKDHLVIEPLILDGGGVPQIFYGDELYEYFHPDALEFSGLSKSEYTKTGRLPEGVYRFTIEILDYNRGTVVSNKGFVMAWIVLNDPPLLNTPANVTQVAIQDPTNLVFSWTPRHSGSPNAAFTTEYIFRLIELWPDDRNPYDAFLTQPALYEVTTTRNQLLYGMNEPALTPGRKYAWQVHARDTDGKDLFRNDGRSEVFVFQFGQALPIPQNLHMRWAKPRTLAIEWNPVRFGTEEIKYRLQYRPRKRRDNHQWYETRTKFTEKTLYDLESNTEYEMKVRTEAPFQDSEYSEIQIFKTLREEKDAFVCRQDIQPLPMPANTVPVFPLSVNDTIHAAGYDVVVRDVIEDGGKYYGSGYAIVPWFNSAKVRVTFENIRVNDRFWLTAGSIKSVWSPESGSLIEHETPILPGTAPQAGELDITIVAADSLVTITGASVASVSINQAGNIVVTTTDGKEKILRKGRSYAIVDEMGNGYVVDEKANIAKTTATEALAAASRGNRQYNLALTFEKGNGRFGFDRKVHEALSSYYQQLEDGTFVSWKALSSGASDIFEARFTSRDGDKTSVKFERSGAPVPPSPSKGEGMILTLSGQSGGMEEELLALHSSSDTLAPKILGKLNLVTYDPVRYNLEVVPVNGASITGGLTAAEISRSLNAVYSQAVVEWNVTLSSRLHVPLDEIFDEGQTGLLSNYTPDMKKVLKAFGRLQDNTYYLFLIDHPRNEGTLGYMPRNRQAGFVFTGPHNGNVSEFLNTIAHELGHGAFNLKHTFSEYNLPAGITDNVMDYSSGTALYKYQWDYIHDPQSVMGLFEGGEEGESVILTDLKQLNEFANDDGSFTFIAPNGAPFTLPAATQSIKFWANDVYGDNTIQADQSPDGALLAFTIDNQTYRYHKILNQSTGSGYKVQEGQPPYVDMLTKKQRTISHVIIGLPCLESGEIKFLAQQVQFDGKFFEQDHSAEGTIVSKLPIEDPYGPYFSSARIHLAAKLDFEYSEEAKAFLEDNATCLNEMVRFVIKAADVIQRNPGYYELYKACTGSPLVYPKQGSSSAQDAFSFGIYYERLKQFPQELLTYADKARRTSNDLLETTDPEALNALLKNTCEPDFQHFTFDQRIHIIRTLSEGKMLDYWLGVGNNRENIVIYTLRQAPEAQYPQLLDALEKDHYALLKNLINKCHNQLAGQDNFDRLIDAVTTMIQKVFLYESFEEDIIEDRILRWGANDLFHGFHYECNEWTSSSSDKITFSFSTLSHHYPGGGEYTGVRIQSEEKEFPTMEVVPFDFVPLKLHDDVLLENGTPLLTKSHGEFQAVPAIYMYWLLQRKATDETLAAIKADVNMALFIVGGAEIIAAKSALRLTLAITDQALFSTSFVLAAGPRRMLEEGPNGPQWQSIFKAFDAFNLLYGAARIGQGLTLAGQEILAKRALLNHLKETEDWTRFTPAQHNVLSKEIARVDDGMDELERAMKDTEVRIRSEIDQQDDMWNTLANMGDAADLNTVPTSLILQKVQRGFLPGWTKERVLQSGKGKYPSPEVYLSKQYILDHLTEFENGVSFLCPLETIGRYRDLLGRPDGVFVMPMGKMDELMDRTHGDISLIETALNIPRGEWAKRKMCRVDVLELDELNIRMPSGNEIGANEYFTPGGFTKDGEMEAIINPIPKDKYEFKPVNYQ